MSLNLQAIQEREAAGEDLPFQVREDRNALIAEVERLTARLDRVRALHHPVNVWEYDMATVEFKTDSEGDKVIMATLCTCSPQEVLTAVDECEYNDSDFPHEIIYPCPTIRALDGEATE